MREKLLGSRVYYEAEFRRSTPAAANNRGMNSTTEAELFECFLNVNVFILVVVASSNLEQGEI